jgi:hypothetical protein
MPLSFVKIPAIQVGQVYECTQKHHLDWQVEVVKVSANHIEARGVPGSPASKSKAHSKNGNYNYLRSQFERDYTLLKDVENTVMSETQLAPSSYETEPAEPEFETRFCSECYQLKPLLAYKSNRGSGYGYKTCISCRRRKASITTKARSAAKLEVDPTVRIVYVAKPTPSEPPTPEPTHVPILNGLAQPASPPSPATSLASRLLELASEVEQLQLSYPTSLLICVRDLLLEVTDAHGVCVVPFSTIDCLQREFNLVKANVQWPTEDTHKE